MKTEEEIIKEIKKLQEVNTTLPSGKTDMLLEFKKAMAISTMLYVLGRVDSLGFDKECVNE